MRKLVPVLLILAMIPALIVPAAAAESDDESNWVDVLDYVYIWGGVSNAGNVGANGSFYIPVSNSDTRRIYEIDMILQLDGVIPSSISFVGPTTVTPTLYKLDFGLYRLRASVDWGHSGGFSVKFTSSGATKVYVLSCNILGVRTDVFDIPFYMEVFDLSGGEYYDSSEFADGVTITHDFYGDGSSYAGFEAVLYADDSVKCDYLDVAIEADLTEINSITADFAGTYVPVDYSYIDAGAYGRDRHQLVLRVDLSGLSDLYDRYDYVKLHISGIYKESDADYLAIKSFKGGLILHSNDPLRSWLRDGFASVVEAVSDLKDVLLGPGEDTSVQDELADQSDQIDTAMGQVAGFEDDQKAAFGNFQETDQTISTGISGFSTSLAFVQHYANGIFSGLGNVSIIYLLPLFLGLFFYICSRVPGVTRWKSPPKGGYGS